MNRRISFLQVLLIISRVVIGLSTPSLMLRSRPQNVTIVYQDQTIVFTCVTRESPILAWSSDHYIGAGGIQLEFLSINQPGATQGGIGDTVAVLTSVDNGGLVLESELNITVSSSFPVSMVACLGVGTGLSDNITFHVSDVPAQTVTFDFEGLVCPGDVLTFVCETLSSPILAWSSDEYIGRGGILLKLLSIESNGTVKRSQFNRNTSAVLTERFERNGVNTIISNLTITVLPAIDRHGHNVTCINVGVGTRNTTTLRQSDECALTETPGETTSYSSTVYAANTMSGMSIVIIIGITVTVTLVSSLWLSSLQY